jgi:hypothetical protein
MKWTTLLLPLLLIACDEPDKPDDTALSPDDTAIEPVDADGDGHSSDVDCDDTDPSVHPNADELCNSLDDDCDGDVDEDAVDAPTWYSDADGDSWGDPEAPVQACSQPEDAVGDSTDCDDDDTASHPGADEVCYDDTDNDCDGETDEDCACPDEYPLEGADAVLFGNTEEGLAGYSVAGAGDVNGDGYDDLIIGAPGAAWEGDELEGYYEGGANGAATIVLGPVSGDQDLEHASAWIEGTYDFDSTRCVSTGWSVAGVGDTNGDGYDDVLIGDPDMFADGYWTRDYPSGMAALFLGPVSGVQHMFAADAIMNWGGYHSDVGYDVAGAGDIDGDGLSDILISAPFGGHADKDGGEVYVLTGPVTGTIHSSDLQAVLTSSSYCAYAGVAVSSAGDVNGDGLDDILVGAPYDSANAEYAGAAYLVLGPVSGTFMLSSSHLRLLGDEAYENVGRAVSDAGDLNGDGYGDFVLGQRGKSLVEHASGAVFVFYGNAHGGQSGDSNLDSAAAALTGTMEYERAAGSVACAGDSDGDGRSDLLVGRDFYDANPDLDGTTWLVHGPITGTWALDDIAATRFTGPNAGDQAGVAVSSAGDVDADGLSDILIGAPGDDTNGSEAGAVYLVLAAGL